MLQPDYFNTICDKCFLMATNNATNNKTTDKQNKISKQTNKNDDYVPKPSEYNLILENNYNISQLKYLNKHYKLRISGTKPQLVSRIYSFLFLSFNATKIQRVFKNQLQKKYN
jgi:hypothetical protein